jgi:hypothetical protein
VSPRHYWPVARPTANKKGQRRTVDLCILVVGTDAGSNPIISVGVDVCLSVRAGAGLNMISILSLIFSSFIVKTAFTRRLMENYL